VVGSKTDGDPCSNVSKLYKHSRLSANNWLCLGNCAAQRKVTMKC